MKSTSKSRHKIFPSPRKLLIPSSHTNHMQALFWFLSLQTSFTFSELRVNRIKQHVFWGFCLCSLHINYIMFLKLMQIVAWISSLFFFKKLMCSFPLYKYTTVVCFLAFLAHFPIGDIWVVSILGSWWIKLLKKFLHKSIRRHSSSLFLGYYLSVELLGHRIDLNLWESTK